MDEEAWTVPDVYLLTTGSEGPVAVPHLRLTFRQQGLELDKADGELVWSCDWSDLVEMAPVERSILPDGQEGVVMVVVERHHRRRRRHRFVLATEDADATEAFVRARAGTHGLRTRWPRPAVSRLLTVAIVAAFAVTLALLMLSAVHVIHF